VFAYSPKEREKVRVSKVVLKKTRQLGRGGEFCFVACV